MVGPTVKRLAAALTLSVAGAAAIVSYEGTSNTVYVDTGGVATVCAGHTATVTLADVGKRVSPEFCDYVFDKDTADAQRTVRSAVTVPITQGQYDALVSFTYNCGNNALRTSTLLKKLNAGDCRGAQAEFPKWSMDNGKFIRGLYRRRQSEAATFGAGC